jgi:hypothetical protein
MPYGSGPRHIVPIQQKAGPIKFRLITDRLTGTQALLVGDIGASVIYWANCVPKPQGPHPAGTSNLTTFSTRVQGAELFTPARMFRHSTPCNQDISAQLKTRQQVTGRIGNVILAPGE